MARIKYFYNEETCKYERIKTTKTDLFVNTFGFVVVAAVLALLFNLVNSIYFPSSALQSAKKEVKELKVYYAQLKKEQDKVNQMLDNLTERDNSIYRVIFEAEPISNEVRNASIGGTDRYKELEDIEFNRKRITKIIKGIDKIRRKMYIQTQSYDSIVAMVQNKEEMLASIPGIAPIKEYISKLASGYGMRMHPIYKIRKLHSGIDFTSKRGTPIYATGNGKVLTSSYARGYGKQIVIDHGYGFKTRYAHLDTFAVTRKQKVKRGDLIGYIGSTGSSTGPHLHYEVIKNGKTVNPVHYFSFDLLPNEYELLLEKAFAENQSLDTF